MRNVQGPMILAKYSVSPLRAQLGWSLLVALACGCGDSPRAQQPNDEVADAGAVDSGQREDTSEIDSIIASGDTDESGPDLSDGSSGGEQTDGNALETPAKLGAPCAALEDCESEQLACNPDTETCELSCATKACGDGEFCLSQGWTSGSTAAACMRTCTPGVKGECGEGFGCVGVYSCAATCAEGVCYRSGDAQAGEACDRTDITSSCEDGLGCEPNPELYKCGDTSCPVSPYVCMTPCNLNAEDPGCPEGTYCAFASAGFYCVGAEEGETTELGATCDPDSDDPSALCGRDDERFQGICNEGTCKKLCGTNADIDLCERLVM